MGESRSKNTAGEASPKSGAGLGEAVAVGPFVETVRATIHPWQCDHMGHMNVQFYMALVGDAVFSMMARLGLGRQGSRDTGLGMAGVRIELDFHAEVFPGDVVAVETALEGVGEKSLRFQHRMSNVETGAPVMTARMAGVCIDLDRRRSAPLPGLVVERARQLAPNPLAPNPLTPAA